MTDSKAAVLQLDVPDYGAPEHIETVARFVDALNQHGPLVFSAHPELVNACKSAMEELLVRRTESTVFGELVDVTMDMIVEEKPHSRTVQVQRNGPYMNHEEALKFLHEMLEDFSFADDECRDDVVKAIVASVTHKHHPKLLLYGREAGVGVGLLASAIYELTKDDTIVVDDGANFTVDGLRVVADDSLGDFIIITLRLDPKDRPYSKHHGGLISWVRIHREKLLEAAKVYGNHISRIF